MRINKILILQGQVKVSSKVDDIEQKKTRGIHELKKKLEKGQDKEVKLFFSKLVSTQILITKNDHFNRGKVVLPKQLLTFGWEIFHAKGISMALVVQIISQQSPEKCKALVSTNRVIIKYISSFKSKYFLESIIYLLWWFQAIFLLSNVI